MHQIHLSWLDTGAGVLSLFASAVVSSPVATAADAGTGAHPRRGYLSNGQRLLSARHGLDGPCLALRHFHRHLRRG